MKSIKEQIAEIIENTLEVGSTGYIRGIGDAADQILSLVQPNSEPQPQMQQANVMGSMDFEKDEAGKCWRCGEPCEECERRDAADKYHKSHISS